MDQLTDPAVVTVVLKVRGTVLPEREERSFWIDGDRLRTEPVADATVVADGGWLLPGLVDAHAHPGSESPTDPFDHDQLRGHLTLHRDGGVLLVRTPGTAERMPDWVDEDPDLPRVRSAGQWLATPGRFFTDYGRHIGEEDLETAAVEEAVASSGWCKIIGDWKPTDPPVPLDRLSAAVQAVHAVGGQVAVHCQTAEGCHNAVLAGADSLEHGMHLDPALLDRMADQGTALVPTLTVFGKNVESFRARERSPFRDWYVAGCEGMAPTVRSAHEAGITVLAGTDSLGFGPVTNEVDWLVRAGLPAEAAVGAASWTARSYLGLPGLVDGAPADLVVYDTDPTKDPDALRHPRRIILRGRVIR